MYVLECDTQAASLESSTCVPFWSVAQVFFFFELLTYVTGAYILQHDYLMLPYSYILLHVAQFLQITPRCPIPTDYFMLQVAGLSLLQVT